MIMRRRAGLLGCLAGVLAASLGGCVGYGTYEPAKNEARDMVEWPYDPASDEVMIAALAYVIDNFPPGTPATAPQVGKFAIERGSEPVAVSLMPGVTAENYARIVAKSDPYAKPYSPQTIDLPRYSVGQIEMRGLAASVDVHRPLPDTVDGFTQYQCLELSMKWDGGAWIVRDYRVWAPGVVTLPRPTYIPPATVKGEKAAPTTAEASATSAEDSR